MENSKFYGYRQVVAGFIHMLCAAGITAIDVIAVGILPQRYGISLTAFTSMFSIITFISFIAYFIASLIIRSVGPKKLMLMCGVLILCWTLLIAFGTKWYFFAFACVAQGLWNGFAAQGTVSALMTNWFYNKRATMIGITIAGTLLGGSIFQFLSGHLFPYIGITGTYLIFGLTTFVIIILVDYFLVISKPEDIGQKALGWEGDPAFKKVYDKAEVKKFSAKNLYKSPVFWIILFALCLGVDSVLLLCMFTTTYLPMHGMSFTSAATFLSAMSICAGIYSFIAGRVIDRINLKVFVIVAYVGASVANYSMVLWGNTHHVIFLGAVFIGYGIGCVSSLMMNFITGPIFGTVYAAVANTKLLSITTLTWTVAIPGITYIAEHFSFQTAFTVIAIGNLVTMSLITLALSMKNKKTHLQLFDLAESE